MVRKRGLADYDDVFEELGNDEQNFKKEVEEPVTEDSYDYLAEFVTKKPEYIQRSFEIKKETYRQMLKYAKKYGHGFQKKFVNAALERELKRIKDLEAKYKKRRGR